MEDHDSISGKEKNYIQKSRLSLSPAQSQRNEYRISFLGGKLTVGKHVGPATGEIKNESDSYSKLKFFLSPNCF
jgi:hypothetical protein